MTRTKCAFKPLPQNEMDCEIYANDINCVKS